MSKSPSRMETHRQTHCSQHMRLQIRRSDGPRFNLRALQIAKVSWGSILPDPHTFRLHLLKKLAAALTHSFLAFHCCVRVRLMLNVQEFPCCYTHVYTKQHVARSIGLLKIGAAIRTCISALAGWTNQIPHSTNPRNATVAQPPQMCCASPLVFNTDY